MVRNWAAMASGEKLRLLADGLRGVFGIKIPAVLAPTRDSGDSAVAHLRTPPKCATQRRGAVRRRPPDIARPGVIEDCGVMRRMRRCSLRFPYRRVWANPFPPSIQPRHWARRTPWRFGSLTAWPVHQSVRLYGRCALHGNLIIVRPNAYSSKPYAAPRIYPYFIYRQIPFP